MDEPQQVISEPEEVTESDIVPTSPQRLDERGMTTAEYAVGTLAAVAMAVALIAVARSDMVRGALARVIQTALGAGG